MKTFLELEITRKLKIANHLERLGSNQAEHFYKLAIDLVIQYITIKESNV